MIILPSINLGVADNSRSSAQCSAISPYPLNDYCYLQVIILDPNCCNSIWNQTCEDLYLVCNTPKPDPIIIITLDPLGYYYDTAPIGPGYAELDTGGSTGAVTFNYIGINATSYGPVGTKPTNAGSYSVTASVAEDSNYNAAVSDPVNFVIEKATPTVTVLPTASEIYYDQTLGDSILTGGTASVAGSFAWADPWAYIFASDYYVVIFTPSDIINYNELYQGEVLVYLTVLPKITPTIEVVPTASNIYSGQALSTSILTGGEASVAGTFEWTDSEGGPIIITNSDSYSVTFIPTDTVHYNEVEISVYLTVLEKITPTIEVVPAASDITSGQTLGDSILTFGEASVAGTFAWTDPSAVITSSDSYSVTFTPSDTIQYNEVEISVYLDALPKSDPAVDSSPTASDIVAGQKLGDSILTGGEATVAGIFEWTDPSMLVYDSDSYSVTFIPDDTVHYNEVEISVNLTLISISLTSINGLVLWLKPEDPFVDSSSANNTPESFVVTVDSEPNSQINSYNSYLFSGTNYIDLKDILSGETTGATAFALCKVTGDYLSNQLGPVFGDFGDNAYGGSHYPWENGNVYDGFASVLRDSFSAPSDITGWHVLTTMRSDQNRYLSINTTGFVDNYPSYNYYSSGTNVGANSYPYGGPFIGLQNWNAAYYWKGNIAEILIYNKELSRSEISAVRNYLSGKYDLPIH